MKRARTNPMRCQVQTRLTPAQARLFEKFTAESRYTRAAAARVLIARGLMLNQEVANEPQAD